MKKTLLILVMAIGLSTLAAEEHTYIMSDYGKPAFTTDDGLFTTLGKKADGMSGPTYNGGQSNLDVRLYAKNTYRITSNTDAKITKITFVISKNGHYSLAELTPNTGAMNAEPERLTDENGWKAWRYSWTGNTNEVTFTIGDYCEFGIDCTEQGKTGEAGTLMFKQLIVESETISALNNASENAFTAFAENGAIYIEGAPSGTTVEIFSIAGARILATPVENGRINATLGNGIYIVKCGGNVRKVVVR